jgi:hypothetical protein
MADENEPPPESKLTRSKERWAREGKFLTGKISRPEEARCRRASISPRIGRRSISA